MSEPIELKVFDKTFTFRKVHGEWEAEQAVTGPTMTPILSAALDRIENTEKILLVIVDLFERMEKILDELDD